MADWTPEGARPLDDGWRPEGARELAEQPAAPAATPTLGPRDTGLFHFARHLTGGLGDKIIAGEGALSDWAHDKTGQTTLADAYNRNLAFNDKTIEASDAAHPVARWVGNAAGVVGSTAALAGGPAALLRAKALLGGGAAAAPAASTAAQALLPRALEGMKVGGALGAVGGFGNSRAEDAAGTLRDVRNGAVLGGLTGGVLPVAGAGLRAVARPLSNALEGMGISAGRRALLGGADSLSSRTAIAPEVVREAVDSGAIRPLGTTQGAYERLQGLVDAHGNAYGGVLRRLENAGVRGPDAGQMAEALSNEGAALERNTMNPALSREYTSSAERLLSKTDGNGELGLTQAEALKRDLQDTARYGRRDETTLNEVRRNIASRVRAANEAAVERQADMAPEAAAEFVPMKQRMGRLLGAEAAAQRGADRAAQRGHFGLMEATMAAPAVAHAAMTHSPMAALGAGALGLGTKLLRSRGPSTAAWAGLGLADALRGNAPNLAPALLPAASEGFAEWLAANPGAAMQARIAALKEKKPEALAQGELP